MLPLWMGRGSRGIEVWLASKECEGTKGIWPEFEADQIGRWFL